MIKSAIFAAAALLAVTPMAANAEAETVSAKVKFGDLDLNTEYGNKTLAKRIRLASEELCHVPLSFASNQAKRGYRACKAGVVEQATAKLAALGIDKPATLAMR